MDENWFLKWFSSPYYDVLYQHRSEEEARAFLDQLLGFLQPEQGSTMLDLACGSGRYSVYLAQKGYDVTGLDISESKINNALKTSMDNLSFFRHDMRVPFRINYYDYVFNFFTSFGYFDTDAEHYKTIQSISKGLKLGGYFLLDYMNVPVVIDQLIPQEERLVDGIRFNISRYVEKGYIVKKIELHHRNKDIEFSERVRAFTLSDFEDMFEQNGLKILNVFGDYRLGEFKRSTSERLILLASRE